MKPKYAELAWIARLPSPPGVGSKIVRLTQRADCTAEEIADVLRADAVSSGRLLRCANSARSRATPPFATIESAAAHLGARAVREVALDLSPLPPDGASRCLGFDYARHWSRSLARAIAARRIGAALGLEHPPEAYVLGLLSEIGSLVLASIHPAEYAAMLVAHARPSRAERCRAERERFDVDHIEISAYLMEDWGLPPAFGRALQARDGAERPPSEGTQSSKEHAGENDRGRDIALYAEVLRAAEALVDLHEDGSRARGPVEESTLRRAALERLRARLSLDAPEFRSWCDAVAAEWIEHGAPLELAPKTRSLVARANESRALDADTRLSETPSADGDASTATTRDAVITPRADSLSILAVDDDPLALKLLERTLVHAGHRVRCAADGSRALEIALETNPQVVIADWMMPNMDGIELCKALRSVDCGRDMFFILLTGRAEEDRVVEAFDAGIDDYVVKPFNPRLLMARLKGGHRVIELKTRVEADRRLILKQLAELEQLTHQLDTAAHTDVLTELPNRRYIMKQLEREWHAAVRGDKPLSLILIDIDHFKHVNDLYGHDVGDLVLKETARVLRETTRQHEELARLGGEEFVIVCSGATEEEAAAGAERMRVAVEQHEIVAGGFHGRVTISSGVAGRRTDMSSIDAFLKAADAAVYQAKHAGRNCVATDTRSSDRERRSA